MQNAINKREVFKDKVEDKIKKYNGKMKELKRKSFPDTQSIEKLEKKIKTCDELLQHSKNRIRALNNRLLHGSTSSIRPVRLKQ